MNREELLSKINEWHEKDEHRKIINTIEALPREEWDYKLTYLLARACNNTVEMGGTAPEGEQERYGLLEKAVSLLESVQEAGKDDPCWHFHMGYALYYLYREEEAFDCFSRVVELDPNNHDAQVFLNLCDPTPSPDLIMYTKDETKVIEDHIVKYFGEFEDVFHDITSIDIHLDICLIPPSKEHDYYTLVTMGMGAYRMNVPAELSECKLERAELAITLPPDWKLDQESLQDEKWYWPIRLLDSTARLPIQYDTWLGLGHTVGLDEGKTYADNTELCGCILIDQPFSEDDGAVCVLPTGENVNFYQVIPLYKDEIEYKTKHGVDALFHKWSGKVSYVVDPCRPSAIE